MGEFFELREIEGSTKVIPLDEALRQAIRPGMKLHVTMGNDPNAALRELIRQYWGKKPDFTLISSGVTTPYLISLVCSGLVKKVITTNCSYTYPIPRPISLLQQAQRRGLLEIESWSLYSLEQRLMAGALGLGFMPTRSIQGTSLAEENAHSFKLISDPFEGNVEVGVVRALEPDVSLVHGCAADKYGNTILAPPYFTSIWGPRASRNGVIVTVEKLVPEEFIRRHSALVKIPGYLVRSVSVVPLGSHPQALAGGVIGLAEGYGEDYDFLREFQKVSQERSRLNNWLEEWVVGCPTQEDYLRKLGEGRIRQLRRKSGAGVGESATAPPSEETRPAELMVVAAAREVKAKVMQEGHRIVLAGIGLSGLAAWLAYYLLRREGWEVDLLTGTGLVGYAPRPGDPFLMTPLNLLTCKMLTDTVEVYGTFVGGAQNRCLSVLGTAQIDKHGNLNTLKMGELYFIGPGGAGDAVNARETLVVTRQSRERLVEAVPFVSCPGDRVNMLVTDRGIFAKVGGERTFTLTKYFSRPGFSSRETCLRKIRENCGWELRVAEDLEEVAPPNAEELAILRSLDPQGVFIGK